MFATPCGVEEADMGNKGKYPINRFNAVTPVGDCPLGGDVQHDCLDCMYSADYHYEGGECVRREEEDNGTSTV